MNNPCLGFQNTHLQTKRQDLAEAIQELGTAPLDVRTPGSEWNVIEDHGR